MRFHSVDWFEKMRLRKWQRKSNVVAPEKSPKARTRSSGRMQLHGGTANELMMQPCIATKELNKTMLFIANLF